MTESFEPRTELHNILEIAAHNQPDKVIAEEELSRKQQYILHKPILTCYLRKAKLHSIVLGNSNLSILMEMVE